MNKSVFKAVDIRGVYPEDMNGSVASAVARVCANILPEGEVLVAYDARHGSPELANVATEAFKQEAERLNKKSAVRFIGFSSTPMFYFLVNHFNASGGMMITASHNPKNYNGMKVVRQGAEMISGTELLAEITRLNIQ